MGTRIHRYISGYLRFIGRHQLATLLFYLLSFFACAVLASTLALKSNLKELLPPNYQSVRELNRVLERVGGVGSLIVAVEGPDEESNKRFLDDLAVRLQELPQGQIRYLSYKADDVRRFYEDRFLYYLDIGDLQRFHRRLKQRVDFEKYKRTPFYLELGDEGDEPAPLQIADIREKVERKYTAPISTYEDYFGGEWGRLLIMMIRPYGATITLDGSRKLVSTVEAIVDDLKPASYNPQMRVGLCGNVKSTIEEYETLKHDILSTALMCLGLVAAVIALFFLRLRIVFLLGATLLIAVAWTFALTRGVIGYLNAQTAFLGSIIVGTGINYGIILMARYLEERKKERSPLESMQHALEMTVRPTFLAAATTAVSFGVLLIARIRGLSQFGFIGASGVIFCWISTMLVLPVMTLVSERILRFVRPRQTPKRESALFELATKIGSRSPAVILVLASVAAIVATVVVWRFIPNAIEYDFTKMRNQVSVASGTEALEKRVSKLFRSSMTPSVVLVDSADEGPQVCQAVERQNLDLHPQERRVGNCSSIFDLLPPDQEGKLPIIARIGRLLNQDWVNDVSGELRRQIERIRTSIIGRALTIEDLPDTLARHFEDLDGNRGAVVFINPRPGMPLSDGRNLMRYADTIRNIQLEDGRILHAASASIIFADLIEIIKVEAPYLTIASFLGVLLFVLIILRRMRLSLELITALIWAVLMMVGVAAFMDIKINFFNFIVLPLTFGVGVDYALNMAMRIRQEGPQGVSSALKRTGGAVVLCSMTTIIGYFVLTTANNQALATFGVAAVIGEIACITAAVLLLPALIVIVDRVRQLKVKRER